VGGSPLTGVCPDCKRAFSSIARPVIQPGESFRYTSGCPLTTPSGIMVGTYQMLDAAGQPFEVEIPAFSLDSPFAKRVLN
jgi:ApaG protein